MNFLNLMLSTKNLLNIFNDIRFQDLKRAAKARIIAELWLVALVNVDTGGVEVHLDLHYLVYAWVVYVRVGRRCSRFVF